MAIIVYAIIVVVALALVLIARSWITIYNKFQYWRNKAEKRFAGIDVIMQQRIDMLPALAQAIKKYDIHEYKAIKDTIEARSRWTKDAPLNERVQAAQEIENNFLKIQTVFERYPKLKAERLHEKIMGHGNISHMESKLARYRLGYNEVVVHTTSCFNNLASQQACISKTESNQYATYYDNFLSRSPVACPQFIINAQASCSCISNGCSLVYKTG